MPRNRIQSVHLRSVAWRRGRRRALRGAPIAPVLLVAAFAVYVIGGVSATGQTPSPLERVLGSEEASTDGEDDRESRDVEPVEEPPLPPVSELVPRGVRLSEQGDRAIETVEEAADVSALEARAEELAGALRQVRDRLEDALGTDYVRDRRVEAILGEALFLQRRIDGAMADAAERVQRLDAVRSDWLRRRELWVRWRASLRDDPQYESVYRDPVTDGLQSIDRVLEAANDRVPALIGVQQRFQFLDASNQKVADRARKALRAWSRKLLQRTSPMLLGAEHRALLTRAPGMDLRKGLERSLGDGVAFGGRHGAILGFQITAALLLGWSLRRLGRRMPPASRWATVLDRPWSIGVLVSAVASTFLYGPLSPAGRLALGIVVAASTAVVAAGMFAHRTKRLVVYTISAAYVLFTAVEAVALPLPLLRLVLAGIALAGVPALLVLTRRSARAEPGENRGFQIALRLGAAALALVFGAEVAGFHALAQWVFETGVVTAFVGFVAAFLLRLGRGGIYLALRSAGARRIGIPARIGDVLSERLLFLLKIGIIGYGLLYLAAVWQLADSAAEAWKRVVGAGLRVGDWELTVGKLLLAALVVYLALAASWVVRTVLDRAVFEQRSFERGVRDSIATLLHYSLIVIGVFLALTLFGLDLSNLALIAGALSVGIGFGLQNVVNNFVSGLILLFERPVRVGDIVEVVGAERGTISKIGLRSTVLTTFNGAEQVVPNGDLISEKVVNWTLSTPRVRLVLPVSVAYGNDPARVIEVLLEVGRRYELTLEDPEPMAIFTGFGDSSLDFELRVWLAAYDQLLDARSALAARLVERFGEEGIVIPFPQRDLHLRTMAPEARAGLGARDAPERGTDAGAPVDGSARDPGPGGDAEG